MTTLRTLGKLALEPSASPPLSSPRKTLALLAYLCRRSPRPASRGALAALLWEERQEARARQSLRQTLLELKRVLGDGLVLDDDQVSVMAGAVMLDAALLEQSITAGRFDDAISHWQGEFLADAEDAGGEEFRGWLEAEREALRRQVALAFSRTAEAAAGRGAWHEGAAVAERWAEVLPLDERAHQRLIEFLHRDGRTAAGLARYAEFAARLRTELGVAPPAEAVQLAAQLERSLVRDARDRSPGSVALFTPDLAGRGAEMAALESARTATLQGTVVGVLLEGETGVGKTRLCEEFLRWVEQRSAAVVLRARAHEQERVSDLGVARELARGLVHAPGLGGATPRTLAEIARLAPGVAERFPALPAPVGTEAALQDAMVEALDAVSDEQPVILWVDNLPLADDASRRLVLAATTKVRSRLLYLFTARTSEGAGAEGGLELHARTGLRRLLLQPLGVLEIEELVGSMLELLPPDRRDLARRVHAHGGGNPLYTSEIVSALVDEAVLVPADDGVWRMAGQSRELPLPASLQEVVGRRLAGLRAEARRMADAAAVLGPTFELGMLADLSGLEPGTAGAALDELITRKIVRPVAGAAGAYEFAHELLPRVAYANLSAAARDSMHQGAAAAWSRTPKHREGRAAALAYHRTRARAPRARWRGPAALAAATVALLAFATGATNSLLPPGRLATLRTIVTRSEPVLSPRRVVVAPLANRTGDTLLAAFGDLAADWVALGLMRTGEFEVVDPRTAAIAGRIVKRIPRLLRDGSLDLALAEETGAGNLIAGAFYLQGDSIRALVHLTETATGRRLRSLAPVVGRRSDLGALAGAIQRRAVAALASATDTTSAGLAAGLGEPPSYDAYVETSRAWESFFRDDTADVFRRIAHAIALDSTYVPPLLMRAYVRTRYEQWAEADAGLEEVRRRRAELTPTEVAALDVIEADLAGDLPARLRAARDLMRLTPASVEGFTLAADIALRLNRPSEALEYLKGVDPQRGLLLIAPYYWYTSGRALHALRAHDREIAIIRRGLRQFPADNYLHYMYVSALAANGEVARAKAAALEPVPGDAEPQYQVRVRLTGVALELRAHGRALEGRHLLDSLALAPSPAPKDSTHRPFEQRLQAEIFYQSGRWAAASAALDTLATLQPGDLWVLGRRGTIAARRGDRAEAGRIATALAAGAPYLHGRDTFWRAHIAAAGHDSTALVPLLQAALAQGYPVTADLDLDPHLDRDFGELVGFRPLEALLLAPRP